MQSLRFEVWEKEETIWKRMTFLGSPSCCVVCSLSSRLLQKKIRALPRPLHHYTKRNRPDYFPNANASPRRFVKCLAQKKKKQSQAESAEADTQFQFERLFSTLNQATLKREPGSLSSAVFLVAGTTVWNPFFFLFFSFPLFNRLSRLFLFLATCKFLSGKLIGIWNNGLL